MMIEHKIVVVGCGVMSNTWLDYAEQRKNAEIVGLVDMNIETAKTMAERRKLDVAIYFDLSQALKETEANLVFDVTITAAHKQVITSELQSICHVICDNPMTLTYVDSH